MVVILPENPPYSEKLKALLSPLLPAGTIWAEHEAALDGLRGEKLLFAAALDEGGCSAGYYRMLSVLRRGNGLLEG